jgi:rhodanese-related sulfurtransferase
MNMKGISASDLQELLNAGTHVVIDIREPYEYVACNIGSKHIPMGEICNRVSELPKDKELVIMCRSGKRAEAVANVLISDHGLSNVLILEGGITAWKEEIDPTLDLDA